MAYQPLARKYRPSRFSELVGQEAVAIALANAIRLGREPHGLILTGVRGIGKTTIARLYAKALNCDSGPTAEPCDRCESCLAIARGHHEDVLEIDGASNTSVDDVRALRETIGYVAQRSKFKVYLIDEVHMLSQSAFNALLKTLEEPPAHVVFIFATTELARVPQTIVSRCQTYFLRKLATATILDRLRFILQTEGIGFEEKALAIIAREGHGSMRDALTALDQAIALGAGQVTLKGLEGFITNLSSAPYLDVLDALVARDGERALAALAALDQAGVEFAEAVEDMARFARHAFVLRDLGPDALDTAHLGLDADEIERLRDLSAKAAAFDLNRIFRSLLKCRTELDGSGLDRYVTENYALEWCLDPGLPDFDRWLRQDTQGAPAPAPKPAAPAVKKNFLAELKSTPKPNTSGNATTLSQRGQSPGAAADPGGKPLLAQLKHQPDSSPTNRDGSSVAIAKDSVLLQPLSPPEAQQLAAAGKPQLPPDWPAFVEVWKQLKPLQGRQLEEAYLVAYSAERIAIAVNESTLAGKALLQKDNQAKLVEQFRELFAFNGIFSVTAREAHVTPASAVTNDKDESLLERRKREASERRASLAEELRNSPITQDVLAVFGGKIEDVRFKDG